MAETKKISDKIQEAFAKVRQKIEDGVVSGFDRVSGFFVGHIFTRRGETVEEARQRLTGRDRK